MRGEWGVSIRRACRSRHPEPAGLERRIREICRTRVRYGDRRVHVLLRREGWRVHHKKSRRIYEELGLQLRSKTPKRRVKAKLREDRCAATRPNEIWAMDFVHDQLATGRKLRILTVVDIFSRYSPVIDPRLSYRGEDGVQVLERTCAETGHPTTIRVTRARSSSAVTWICERMPGVSRWTSRGPASPPTWTVWPMVKLNKPPDCRIAMK